MAIVHNIDWGDLLDADAFNVLVSLEKSEQISTLPMAEQQAQLKKICHGVVGKKLPLCHSK